MFIPLEVVVAAKGLFRTSPTNFWMPRRLHPNSCCDPDMCCGCVDHRHNATDLYASPILFLTPVLAMLRCLCSIVYVCLYFAYLPPSCSRCPVPYACSPHLHCTLPVAPSCGLPLTCALLAIVSLLLSPIWEVQLWPSSWLLLTDSPPDYELARATLTEALFRREFASFPSHHIKSHYDPVLPSSPSFDRYTDTPSPGSA